MIIREAAPEDAQALKVLYAAGIQRLVPLEERSPA